MSPPINRDSTLQRVRALLSMPRSSISIAIELGVSEKQVSRAIWHLRSRGAVRIAARRPVYAYVVGQDAERVAGVLEAMQAAARAAQSLRNAA